MKAEDQTKEKQLDILRHSTAHILAAAVLEFFPKAKLGIGPTIENGFYYDFALPAEALAKARLDSLEKRMRELIKKDLKFKKEKISPAQAKKLFANQPYKLELIKELIKTKFPITIYTSGDFTDLCKGPHVKSAKEINPDAFKLTKIAGAYWRGDEKNKMLTRIYGVAFNTKNELDEYLKLREEAKKRDHRVIGQKQNLFFFHETAPGMPYWLPNGLHILNTLVDFWRQEHTKRGYIEIAAPLINKKKLYEISGHWEHYRKEMFISQTEDKEVYALKPMNCPNAMVIYQQQSRSYRELPMRLGDTDVLHRNELSGTLSGLFRVRSFRQDDAHIFVSEEQIEEEYRRIFEIIQLFYSIFNMEYYFRLSTKPDEFMGDSKTWDKARNILDKILKNSGKKYVIGDKEGAFYGPKVDIMMKDSLGREWQMGTVQLDFQIPRAFKLVYTDEKGKQKTPVCLHRVIYGSLERFIGILIEHFSGALPLWLSPVQAVILPIGEKQISYANKISDALKKENIKVEIPEANETLGKRIREAEIQKIPYILVVGDKEMGNATINVRHYRRGQEGEIKTENLIEKLKEEIENKII